VSSSGGRINFEMVPLRRLIDDPTNQASAAFADIWSLGLLRSATPYQTTAGRKQRVWMGLAHPVDRRPKVAVRRLVFVAILAIFGGATAIASAALGHWPAWATRAYERLVPRSSPLAAVTPPDSSPARTRRGFRSSANAAGLSAEGVAASGELPVPVTEQLPSAAGATQRTASERRDHARVRHVPQTAVAAAVQEETAPVLAAMRALRRDRNPARARALLDTYLTEHPNGALAEEALAMSIEAAVAHHDSDARLLAERYARSYPNGPFRVLAKRTLTVPPMQ
jgi:hypothetical protein